MENIDNYTYLTIPDEYVCTYYKLLSYMADFGKTIIDDCNASCKGSGRNILTCWNLFQAALAAYELGRTKEADFFINYIERQLKQIYKNVGTFNLDVFPNSVDEEGHVSILVGCGDNNTDVDQIFELDPFTGRLSYNTASDTTKEYSIENNDLICTKV